MNLFEKIMLTYSVTVLSAVNLLGIAVICGWHR